jgi:hypothetical protein
MSFPRRRESKKNLKNNKKIQIKHFIVIFCSILRFYILELLVWIPVFTGMTKRYRVTSETEWQLKYSEIHFIPSFLPCHSRAERQAERIS